VAVQALTGFTETVSTRSIVYRYMNEHMHLLSTVGGIIRARRPGAPVKFSLDPDLSEADCRKLLDRYTPKHMRGNKATQKLFIKSAISNTSAVLDNVL